MKEFKTIPKAKFNPSKHRQPQQMEVPSHEVALRIVDPNIRQQLRMEEDKLHNFTVQVGQRHDLLVNEFAKYQQMPECDAKVQHGQAVEQLANQVRSLRRELNNMRHTLMVLDAKVNGDMK